MEFSKSRFSTCVGLFRCLQILWTINRVSVLCRRGAYRARPRAFSEALELPIIAGQDEASYKLNRSPLKSPDAILIMEDIIRQMFGISTVNNYISSRTSLDYSLILLAK